MYTKLYQPSILDFTKLNIYDDVKIIISDLKKRTIEQLQENFKGGKINLYYKRYQEHKKRYLELKKNKLI